MTTVKVAHIITKLELGGAQKQLLSLIRSLDRKKFRVFLFTASQGLLASEAASIPGLTLYKSKYLERRINPFKDLLALIEISRFISQHQIRIVHTHSSKAGILGRFAARMAKAQVVIHTVHGWGFHRYQPFLEHWFFKNLERLAARFSERIIAVSPADKKTGLQSGIGREDKYSLVNYGINYAQFSGKRACGIRKEFGIADNAPLVTNISCFKPQKSPLDYVKFTYLVSQSLPQARFLFVGDGLLRGKIEKMILRLGLQERVFLTGWRGDIAEILSASDILVLTSLWEGMPVVALEAMAAGCPVIATRTGGVEELIRDGENGFLVAPKDMHTASEKGVRLLKDKNLRESISLKAKASLNGNFFLELMAAETCRVYEKLILNKGGVYAA